MQIINNGTAGIVVVHGDVSGNGTTIIGQNYYATPTHPPSKLDTKAKDEPSEEDS